MRETRKERREERESVGWRRFLIFFFSALSHIRFNISGSRPLSSPCRYIRLFVSLGRKIFWLSLSQSSCGGGYVCLGLPAYVYVLRPLCCRGDDTPVDLSYPNQAPFSFSSVFCTFLSESESESWFLSFFGVSFFRSSEILQASEALEVGCDSL